MDYAALYTELTTDPAAVGYASAVTAGNDNACAALLNAPSAAVVTLTSIGKGALLRGIIPALDQLASGVDVNASALTAQIQSKWNNRFAALRAGDDVIALDAPLMVMLGQLVTDNIVTQAVIDAFSKRTGSRAEVLFGAGTVVQPHDVTVAMGRA